MRDLGGNILLIFISIKNCNGFVYVQKAFFTTKNEKLISSHYIKGTNVNACSGSLLM